MLAVPDIGRPTKGGTCRPRRRSGYRPTVLALASVIFVWSGCIAEQMLANLNTARSSVRRDCVDSVQYIGTAGDSNRRVFPSELLCCDTV